MTPSRSRRRRGFPRLLSAGLVCAAMSGAIEAHAQTVPSAEPGWRFSLTPYGWAPSVSGTLRYGPLEQQGTGVSGAEVGIGATTLLEDLRFVAMMAGEARYGRFSLATDFIYLSLGSANSTVRSVDFGREGRVSSSANAGTETSLKTTLVSVTPGYTLAQGSWGHVDGQFGFRLLSLSADTSVRLDRDLTGPRTGLAFSRQGQLSRTDTLVDGIIGLRGRFVLGGGFSLPYALDVGTGSSRLTWQALGGVNYQTGWAGVTVGYRYLSYEAGGNALVQNLSLGGPFIALNMSF